jgi:hypothetical protein
MKCSFRKIFLFEIFILYQTFISSKAEGSKEFEFTIESSSDNLFYITLNIGTPSQITKLILDSSNFSFTILQKDEKNNNNSFNQRKSTSFVQVEKDIEFQVLNKKYKAIGGKDVIEFKQNLKIKDTLLKIIYKNSSFPGTLGIGFMSNNTESFINQMKNLGIIDRSVVCLSTKKNSEGSLYIGGINEDLTTEKDLTWHNVSVLFSKFGNYSSWYIESDKILINDFIINETQRISFVSSYNKILIPKSFFFKYSDKIFDKERHCQIWEDGSFHCKCNKKHYKNQLPKFIFNINGITSKKNEIYFSPHDYVLSNIKQHINPILNCTLSIGLNYFSEEWVLGTNFMNNYHLFLDLDKNKISFKDNRPKQKPEKSNFIIFLALFLLGSTIFLTCLYMLYKKFFRSPTNNQNSMTRNTNFFHRS